MSNRKLPQVALRLPMPRPGFTEGISDGEKIIGSVRRLVRVDFDQRRPLAVLSVAGVYIGRVATMDDAVRVLRRYQIEEKRRREEAKERRDAEGRVG